MWEWIFCTSPPLAKPKLVAREHRPEAKWPSRHTYFIAALDWRCPFTCELWLVRSVEIVMAITSQGRITSCQRSENPSWWINQNSYLTRLLFHSPFARSERYRQQIHAWMCVWERYKLYFSKWSLLQMLLSHLPYAKLHPAIQPSNCTTNPPAIASQAVWKREASASFNRDWTLALFLHIIAPWSLILFILLGSSNSMLFQTWLRIF